MNHLVWKLGDGCDRTKRNTTEKKELLSKTNEIALNDDKIYPTNSCSVYETHNQSNFIREKNNIKMSEREPIIQSNLNPFLQSTGYISDLETQDRFLRPQDSNYKVKQNSL